MCPDSFDLSLTPLSLSSLPPILHEGNCLQVAVECVKEWTDKLNSLMKETVGMSKRLKRNKIYFLTKLVSY